MMVNSTLERFLFVGVTFDCLQIHGVKKHFRGSYRLIRRTHKLDMTPEHKFDVLINVIF